MEGHVPPPCHARVLSYTHRLQCQFVAPAATLSLLLDVHCIIVKLNNSHNHSRQACPIDDAYAIEVLSDSDIVINVAQMRIIATSFPLSFTVVHDHRST